MRPYGERSTSVSHTTIGPHQWPLVEVAVGMEEEVAVVEKEVAREVHLTVSATISVTHGLQSQGAWLERGGSGSGAIGTGRGFGLGESTVRASG